jgi:RNA polymerase sigma-70 factor (ECF subfamily)
MLRLMFTCCHPALELSAQVALTLNTIAGLRVEEIARAFLIPVPTMAQRLVRAKRKIVAAKIPYVVPERQELAPRTEGLLRVLYLIFNEGYSSTQGMLPIRDELCDHAIGLAREVTELIVEDGNAIGLLALMLLQDSRRAARIDAAGDLVLLDEQDRSSWNQARIQEGCALTKEALRRAPQAPYAIQAAIAAVHAEAARADHTDWRQIVALYDHLLQVEPSAVVALNRAVAVAMAQGPEAGLALTAELEEPLARYHLLHATRGELLRRSGQFEHARSAFERALSLCENEAEQRLLVRKLAAVKN